MLVWVWMAGLAAAGPLDSAMSRDLGGQLGIGIGVDSDLVGGHAVHGVARFKFGKILTIEPGLRALRRSETELDRLAADDRTNRDALGLETGAALTTRLKLGQSPRTDFGLLLGGEYGRTTLKGTEIRTTPGLNGADAQTETFEYARDDLRLSGRLGLSTERWLHNDLSVGLDLYAEVVDWTRSEQTWTPGGRARGREVASSAALELGFSPGIAVTLTLYL